MQVLESIDVEVSELEMLLARAQDVLLALKRKSEKESNDAIQANLAEVGYSMLLRIAHSLTEASLAVKELFELRNATKASCWRVKNLVLKAEFEKLFSFLGMKAMRSC